MWRFGGLVALLFTVSSLHAATPDIRDTAALEAFVDGVMASGLETHNIAGAVVGLVKDNQILLTKGYGFADVDAQKPVDPETTLFRIGSVSKLFTWTALMQLEEQGLIELNEDVNVYLQTLQIPQTFAEPITVAHLMTHTGGLEDRIINLFALDESAMLPYAEILGGDLPDRVRPPGQISSYSNHGSGVAGLVVEDVSGLSWPDYVQQHILDPLGMRHATAHQPVPEALLGDLSNGYRFVDGKFVSQAFEYVPLGAAGGMSVSASDMLRFAMAHLNDGELEGQRILSAETAARMRSALFQPYPELNGWLHGFIDLSRGGEAIYGHNGGTFFFFTQFSLFPERGLGVFVSTNTAGGGKLNGELLRGLMERYFPHDYELPDAYSQGNPADYVGSYGTFRHPHSTPAKLLRLTGVAQVSETGEGELRLDLGETPSYWRMTAEGVFSRVDEPGTLRFVDVEGQRLMFVGSAGGSFYQLTGIHSPGLQNAVFLVAILIVLWALIAWPIIRIRRGHWLEGRQGQARVLGWLMSLTIVMVLAVVAGNASDGIVYGLPMTMNIVLWLPVLTLMLLIAHVTLLIKLRGAADISVSAWIFQLLLALAVLAMVSLFGYWNLIGG